MNKGGKNMDKKKIFIFSALILLMACGMFVTVYVASNMTTDDDKPHKTKVVEKPNHQATEKENNNEKLPSSNDNVQEDEEDEEQDQDKPLTTDVFKKPKKTNTESISTQESIAFENSARVLFQRLDFIKGSEYLYEPTRKYSEEGKGEILHILYQDGSMLANIGHSSEEDEVGREGHVTNVDGMLSILKGIRDPEMALLGILSVELEDRNQLIPSLDSLNPVFDGDIQIVSKSEETGDILSSLSVMYDVKKVHRIDFIVDGYNLFAYVMEDSQGYSRLYSIYEVEEGSTNFLTVSKWNELFKQSAPSKSKPTTQNETKQETTKEGGK